MLTLSNYSFTQSGDLILLSQCTFHPVIDLSPGYMCLCGLGSRRKSTLCY